MLEESDTEPDLESSLYLTTTFNPEFNGLGEIVRKNWDLLKCSQATKILAETRVGMGYRRPPNLKDILVGAKVPTLEARSEQRPCSKYSNKCCNLKCKFCPLLDKSGRIKSTFTGREYEAKRNVTCKSSNLIYCITCRRCNKQYVGQTGNTLHEHFRAHSGSIGRKSLSEDVGRHFITDSHIGLKDMIISIVDFIHVHPKSEHGITLRLQIEFNWIQRLRTMLPMGVNTKDRTPLDMKCRSWGHYRNRGKMAQQTTSN